MVRKRRFAAGDVIAHQGDAVRKAMVPMSGEVSLRARSDVLLSPDGIPAYVAHPILTAQHSLSTRPLCLSYSHPLPLLLEPSDCPLLPCHSHATLMPLPCHSASRKHPGLKTYRIGQMQLQEKSRVLRFATGKSADPASEQVSRRFPGVKQGTVCVVQK